MKQFLIAIAIIGAIGLGVGITKYQQTITSDRYVTNNFTDENAARNLFMDGCDSTGDMTAYCSCVWSDLRVVYTIQQLSEMGIEYNKTGVVPEGMLVSARNCVGNIQ